MRKAHRAFVVALLRRRQRSRVTRPATETAIFRNPLDRGTFAFWGHTAGGGHIPRVIRLEKFLE